MGMTERRRAGAEPPKFVGRPALVLERTGAPWTVEAAWRTSAGPVHIEVGYSQSADDTAVVDYLARVHEQWDPVAVLVRSGSAAADLIPKLEKAGIEVTAVNKTEVAQACGGFLNAALASELSHSDQPILTDGVSMATKKTLPAGGFVWDLIEATAYAQLIGSSLAHYGLVKYGVVKRKTVAPRTGARPTIQAPTRRRSSDLNVMTTSF